MRHFPGSFAHQTMPIGKTARIQQADKQFGKQLNQIKRICENELSRETRCLEEVFRLEMIQHQLQHQETVCLLQRIKQICHRRDAVMKRSFERILKKFSFSSVYDSDATLPPIQGIPRHKLLPKTAPGKLAVKTPDHHRNDVVSRRGGLDTRPKQTTIERASATSSWKKIKVTLPRCEADELTPAATMATNPLNSHEASAASIVGIAARRSRMKSQECSGFMVPACVATKPMPRARDRYIQSLQKKVSLCDIKECAYLRISTDLAATATR